MGKFALSLAFFVLVFFIALIVRGKYSAAGESPGLDQGKLKPCSDKPNCICSEYNSMPDHYIEPVAVSAEKIELAQRLAKEVIAQTGGNLQQETEDYLAATYTSSVFRFVDDLEIRIDSVTKLLHIRAASRVGYSDFGVNLKRAKKIRNLLLPLSADQGS